MKTPLRYPGGKSRAAKLIAEFIPSDEKLICSPFLGGGSIELLLEERGHRVKAYDLFKQLVWFWEGLLNSPDELANLCDSYRKSHEDFVIKSKHSSKQVRGLLKEDFKIYQLFLRDADEYSLTNAAMFYAINRSSFSGGTLSGGYSQRAAYARFTDSSIDRVRNFKVNSFTVECQDFKVSIPNNSDAFLYCDPPYALEDSFLYGDNRKMHKGFDHQGLYDILSKRDRWVLSYNDSDSVRDMYKDYKIVDLDWKYGMKNIGGTKMGSSSEILIINK